MPGLTNDQQIVLASLLNSEGNWTSINTWDGEGFTFGPGLSVRGGYYKKAMSLWFKYNPGVKNELIKNGLDPNRISDLQYLQNLRSNKQKLMALRAIGEDPKFSNALVKAEVEVLTGPKGALNFPEFTKGWAINCLIAGSQLTHWRPNSGWFVNPNDFRSLGNKPSVAEVITLFYSEAARLDGQCVKKQPSGCWLVSYDEGISRFSNWFHGEEIKEEFINSNVSAHVHTGHLRNKLIFQGNHLLSYAYDLSDTTSAQ